MILNEGQRRDVESNISRHKNWQILKIWNCEGQHTMGIFTTEIKLAVFF